MSVQRRPRPTLDQFFTIEAIDRVGLTAEVLGVFYQAKVGVIEVVARRLNPKWAVVRVEADFIRRAQARDLIALLSKIPDVLRVLGPDEPCLQILEDALPPRRAGRTHVLTPTPYICGDVVHNDHHFYGRQEELAKLHDLLDTQRHGAMTGTMVFITGPLKTGKSSLALRFGRELLGRSEEKTATSATSAAPSPGQQPAISTALERTGGRREDAAKLLGWGRNTLTRKIQELGIRDV